MPVFFVPSECISQQAISVTGDVLTHLRDSLRVTVGETVLFSDGTGRRYRTQVTAVTKQDLTGRIVETLTQPAQRAPVLTLGQALLKGEKMDWVIQKATELGVSEIMPIATQHSVVRLKADRVDHQRARWQRIALEAAQQSEQWRVPKIASPQSLGSLLTGHARSEVIFMLVERRNGTSVQAVELPRDLNRSALVVIGPEGGWSKDEMELAEQAGVEPVTLGQSILRSETAAVATISILHSRLGHLG